MCRSAWRHISAGYLELALRHLKDLCVARMEDA